MPQVITVVLPKRFPLVIQPENRDADTAKDAKLINAYVETDPITKEPHIYKRPGLLQTGTTKSGNGYGVFNWLGDIYSIFGATMYKNGVALTGTLDTTGGVYKFSQSRGAIPRMQFGNGVAAYNYSDSAGIVAIGGVSTITAPEMVNGVTYTIATSTGSTNFTLTGAASNTVGEVFTATGLGLTYAGLFVPGLIYTIVSLGTTDWVAIGALGNILGVVFIATGVGSGTGSATAVQRGTDTVTTVSNFPTAAVKGWAYLDGTTYVMDANASIRGCASLNDPTDWSDVLNRLTAQIEADGGVFLAQQLVYVLALGQWSTEVFYDALNQAGSPLGPVQGAKINYGCANQDSVREIDGALFWLATNRSAAVQVVMIEKLVTTIISTDPLERILGAADLSSVHSFGLKYGGHRFYGITLIASNLTFVYDVNEQRWAQWTDENGNYFPIVATSFILSTGSILQHETNGKLYMLDSAYTTDDGDAITVDIYTQNFDGGTQRRKQLNILSFVADQTPGSYLDVRYNDKDYKATAWTNFRRVDLNLEKPLLENNGSFVRRAYHLRHKCNTRLRIAAAELQLDLGTL
jgi:hypothetical protein